MKCITRSRHQNRRIFWRKPANAAFYESHEMSDQCFAGPGCHTERSGRLREQFHPPRSEYVNNHPNCLHLWKPVGAEFSMPDSILVGIKEAA